MAGKRKIVRERTSRKTRTKKNKAEEEKLSNHNDSEFTKDEEEEPLLIHIHPSPKKPSSSGSCNRGGNTSSVDRDDCNSNDEYESANNDRKEIAMGTDNEDDDDGNENDNEDEEHKNKYEVRQRVLARDEDGILYYANIRRKLYGIDHQKTISCLGIFNLAPEELIENKKTADEGERESENNEIDKSQANNKNEWHYFVHYEGWKTLWDRWVSESDILEVAPQNIERMKHISKTHKAFQLEFKEKTKKRKIQNGGIFVQRWKQRLDALNRHWDEKLQQMNTDKSNGVSTNDKEKSKKSSITKKRKTVAKKRNGRSPQEILRDRSKLAVQSCLTTRQPSHIQAIPLSFGLKKILVEDWENLNNSNIATDSNRNDASDENSNRDMVHVLPAKVTIRDALSLYLTEKDILWDGKISTNNGEKANCKNGVPTETDPSSNLDQEISPTRHEQTRSDSGKRKGPSKNLIDPSQIVPSSLTEQTISTKGRKNIAVKDCSDFNSNHDNGHDDNRKGMSMQLMKEWTDMADGIVLYFEQALVARLLYPSEISQILVMEDTVIDDNDGETADKTESMPLKVDIYGCEHLLRLLAAIPRILDQQLQDSRKRKLVRKQDKNTSNVKTGVEEDAADQDDAFVEIGSMILAKLQDLSRFLQKNQSALFRSMYRKKTEEEIKRDTKIQKRQERRLKGAAAAAAASQNSLQNSKKQQKLEISGVAHNMPN